MSIQKCIAQDPQWANTYPDDKYSNATFYATDTTIDSNIIAVGTTIIDEKRYVLIAKISYEGDTIWTRNLNTEFEAEGRAVKSWSEGFIIVGTAFKYENNSDLLMVSVDLDGEIIWFKNFEIDGNQVGYGVLKSSSNFIACGYNEEDAANRQLLVLKTDINGDPTWINSYGKENAAETGYSICLRNDGEGDGYYIAGSISNEEAATDSIYTIFLAANGDIIKQKNYGIGTSTFGYAVVHSKAGGFIIAGKTKVDSHFDAAVIKINENDSVLFTNSFGGDYDDIVYAVAEHNDGSLFFTGTTNSFEDRDHTDIYIMRTNNWGDTLHSWVIDNGYADGAYGTFLKNDSDIVAVGFSSTALKSLPWGIFINTSCGHWYKRTLWINNLWCLHDCSLSQTSCFSNDILANNDPSEEQNIIDYLKLMKIKRVVIAKAWDMMCEDVVSTYTTPYPYSTTTTYTGVTSDDPLTNGSDMRTALATFIQRLRTEAHVEEVYVQLRSEKDESAFETGYVYPWTSSVDPLRFNYQMIEGIKAYNSSQPALNRFDGVLIDYEYGSPVFGFQNNPTCDKFKYTRPGWEAFKELLPHVGSLINHGSNAYGLTKFGVYFRQFDVSFLTFIPATPTTPPCTTAVVFAPPIYATNTTVTQQEIADFIEDPSNNLDFIECMMFKKDNTENGNTYDWTNNGDADRPDKWYYGTGSASFFANHLWNFGDNSYAVDLLPAFDFEEDHLGNYANGLYQWSTSNTNCPSPGPHYIPDIENEFFAQFWDWYNYYVIGLGNGFPNNSLACVDPIPLRGVDLFRSELDPLNKCYFDAHYRFHDAAPNYPIYGPNCGAIPDRLANNFNSENIAPLNASVYPIPFTDELNIAVAENVNINSIIVASVTGQIVKRLNLSNSLSSIRITDLASLSSGIYFLKIETSNNATYLKIVKL